MASPDLATGLATSLATSLAIDALLLALDPRKPPAAAAPPLLDAWLLVLLPEDTPDPPFDTRAEALDALSEGLDADLLAALHEALRLTLAPPWALDSTSWPDHRALLLGRLSERLPGLPALPLDHRSTPAVTAPAEPAPLATTGRHEALPRPPAAGPAPLPRPLLAWLAHALREAGRPLTPYELREAALREAVDGLAQGEEDAISQLRDALARSGAALRVEIDTWLHRDALPISGHLLEELVTWCLDLLEGQARPVHLRTLWKELELAGRLRPGLTPWMLRDALARASDAVTFHNEQLLAHVESFEDGGLTLIDRLEELLRAAAAPLPLAELRARLQPGIHYHARAIYGLLLGAPWCLRLSDERFCHLNALGEGVDHWSKDIEEALALLDPARPSRCEALIDALRDRHPQHPLWSREDAPALLWGFLLKAPAAQCGSDGRVALTRTDGGAQLLIEATLEALERLEPAREPRLLQAVTRRYGYRGPQALRDALQRAQARGLIARAGDTWVRATI